MGYAITQNGRVNSATLGKRHRCQDCGTAYYDLGAETPMCPGPSASVSCEEGALLLLEPEEPEEIEEEDTEESVVFLSKILKQQKEESKEDWFDNPEADDSEDDDDWTEEGEVEYVDIDGDD